jgi:hypothetical protein
MNWRDGLAQFGIEQTLNKLPEVTWDRWAGDMDACMIYGWIPRDDGRSDFVVLRFKGGECFNFVTSSHRFSAEFARRLLFQITDHNPCKRVEDFWPKVNCIRL